MTAHSEKEYSLSRYSLRIFCIFLHYLSTSYMSTSNHVVQFRTFKFPQILVVWTVSFDQNILIIFSLSSCSNRLIAQFFSSHPHEYDEVKHFLTSLPEISFSILQKEQLFHAFVSRLFLRVGVRWRARVRAGPVVLQKKKKEKERKGRKKRKKEERKITLMLPSQKKKPGNYLF